MVINAYVLAADPAWIAMSVASYYDIVDTFVVSYDRSRRGWTGESIRVDECLDRLHSLDVAKKMRFCPGDYARPGQTPMENDTHQRRSALAEASTGADWVLAIDTDEVVPNAREFRRRILEEVPRYFRGVEWPMRSVFRQTDCGLFLEVCTLWRRQLSEFPGCVAVRPGVTLRAARRLKEPCWRFEIRRVGFDPVERHPYHAHGVIAKSEAIVHFSWARTERDLVGKLRSWSHSKDFDWPTYLERVWKPAPRRWPWTYNFHPMEPRRWPALRPVRLSVLLPHGPSPQQREGDDRLRNERAGKMG